MESTRVKIDDAVNFFLDELVINGYKQTTLRIYIDIMKEFSQYLYYEYREIEYIDSVTEKHILLFRNFLMKIANFTRSLIDRVISCLRTFFKILTEMHITSTNIMLNVKHTSESKNNLPISLEMQEVEEIAVEMEDNNNAS